MPDVRDYEPHVALVGARRHGGGRARGALRSSRPAAGSCSRSATGRRPRRAALLDELGYAEVATTADLTGRDRVVRAGVSDGRGRRRRDPRRAARDRPDRHRLRPRRRRLLARRRSGGSTARRAADELQPTALVAADLDLLFECVPELRGRAGTIARALLPGAVHARAPEPGAPLPLADRVAPGDDRRARARRSPARAARCSAASARSPRRARTSPAGPTRGRSTRCRRSSARRPRRVVDGGELPGHALDRDRLHRRRAASCCGRARRRRPTRSGSSARCSSIGAVPRLEEERHGRRPGNARPAPQRRPRRRRSRDRRRCSAASSSASATRSS